MLDAIGCIASRAHRDQFGEYEGLLLSEAAQAALARRFDGDHLWSPSQLEGYATCPFRFFAEHLLSLSPLEELTLAGDAGRRGSLLHQVLATVHQQLSAQAAESPEDQSWQADLAERFRRVLDAEVAATPLGGLEQSLREIERRQIEAWATPYAQQEKDYRSRWRHLDEPPQAAYFEVRFGPEVQSDTARPEQDISTPLPFELDLGEEQIRITGQIDRIDVGRVGEVTVFNVIDYKSGREVKLKDEAVRAGRQLQLPLYALAAEELLLADQQAEALAAGYWSIQGKGFEKGALEMRRAEGHALSSSEQWQQLRPQILATVGQLVAGIRGGDFPVVNEDQECTRWCPQSTICRVAQIRSLEKPWPPAPPAEAHQE
jgi:ATP-dependent helicase/DNAse subunit B